MPSLEVQLRIAAEQGDLAQVQELLAAGAHPEGVRESNGRTPLMRAVNRDHREIARLLLEYGADPNREAGIHGTPIEMARSHEVVRLLRAHGATGNHRLPPGECVFCGGDIDFVRVTGTWHGRSGGGRWLEGRCPECDLRYGATHDRGRPSPWSLPHVPQEWLVAPFSPEEVEALNRRLQRYPALEKAWREFLDDRQPGDQLWRYHDPGEERAGLALLRGHVCVATFSPLPRL